ncbi:glycosyl hydrolase family 18 protein [Caldisalinibacter kiritimatiensis]|uniref:Spore peptidoglycan hydrolase (N-acetylglucosaminidase) n=1 Tax=Caldisalinibacter kiritimatiensis TaxID=1304284 RepID=R1CM08_9FIRM|nr:glycosyl hydrolase family 18 protein [Caldisalinibacter kiritimatiensis]EOC99745.1 spore peptidoglycan hydrolase (N-acetylglucosaminidase) [Caldisalinibacter kiritimatiensis]
MVKRISVFLVIVLVLSTLTVLGTMYFKDINPYHTIKAFKEGQTNIVLDDTPINTYSSPIIVDNKILMPVNIIKKYICSDIELSEKYDRVYINISSPKFNLETEELDNRIKQGINLNFLAEKINGEYYLNIKGLEQILGIKVNYIQDTDILVIDKWKDTERIGVLQDNVRLRPKKTIFSFSLDKLSKGEEVLILEKDGEWLKVRTNKGFIGYISSKKVDIQIRKYNIKTQINQVREDWKEPDKINLVWDYVYKYSPDLSKQETIEGLDIISPTWFSIVSENGYVVNNGDINYVQEAHEKGYKVWALIDNGFDRDLTKQILASEEAQKNIINQILVYSSIYDLDGINIDFENVYYEDKDRLTKFVAKITDALKKQNLIVSIDMTVPSLSKNWSMFYDREKLGQIVDYCMVMTYDEHWASSPKSGSVASIGWVERGIEKTLKYIPNEKLLMGIPFYTRIWEETMVNGKVKVKSKALSMKTVQEMIEEKDLDITWLEDIGQYYTEFNEEGKKYRIWIEDENSIKLKAELANKYNLAGVASWRKGFEKEDVWVALNNVIKNSKELMGQREE